MKVNLKYYQLFLVLLLSLQAKSFAQSFNNDSLIFEQLYLISDRDIYCVDETIHVKIYCQYSSQTKGLDWSNVVYCELITPDGRPVVKNKFLVSNKCALGDLSIPRSVISGNYYLRSYTKWMRNQSPYSYNYKQIKIVNPFSIEVIPNIVSKDDKIKVENSEKQKTDFVSITKSDSAFLRNELVQLTIKTKRGDFLPNSTTLSVVKKGTNHSNYLKIDGFERKISEIKYIPETRGVSLSGKVVNKLDSLPVPYSNVWITLLTEEPVTREDLTDANGNFYFDLGKEKGKFDLFIQANTSKDKVEPVVWVDNDYSYAKLNLPFTPFEVADSDAELYKSLMVNSQFKSIFMPDKALPDSIKLSFNKLFYGKPDFVLKIDNFIELPSVEDYIRELLPNIRIRKEGTKRFFKLYGANPEMGFYDPLVMVNLIKFNDAEKILELSPKQIDRVELIEVPFLKGEMIYGGIIHFITKSANFKNINFPDGSIFVEYDMLGEEEKAVGKENNQAVPLIGNCLYWNPSINLSNGGETTLHFNAGSEIGDYEIVIEGLDKENQPFQVRDSFTVK